MSAVRPETSGIYAIQNGHRMYIGSSINIKKRWSTHRRSLRRGEHHSPHLQRAWNLYGEDAFEFVVLEECPAELLIEREQYHFDLCLNKYNCAPVAGSNLGHKHTPESLAKMSVSQKGNKNAAGHIKSPEAREKMRQYNRMREISAETRVKMSAARKGRKGHKHTDETREKLRQANLGRKHTLESREKMRTAAAIRESRKRISKAESDTC